MIINDLQRLRWQLLDECLRDPETEYFMGEATKTNETGRTRSLVDYINRRLAEVNKAWNTSKRMLQNDVELFEKKGARLEPRFRRGHKRILRYCNLEWKNPLLKWGIQPVTQLVTTAAQTLADIESEDGADTLVVVERGRQRTIKTNLTSEVKRILLGYGANIEVLEPAELREEFAQIASAWAKMYLKAEIEVEVVADATPAPAEPIVEVAPVVEPAPAEEPTPVVVEEAPAETPAEPVVEEAPFVEPEPEVAPEPEPVAEVPVVETPAPEPEPEPAPAPVAEQPKEDAAAKNHKKGEQLDLFGDLFG